MKKLLIKLIEMYQKHISKWLESKNINCKFYPTCSELLFSNYFIYTYYFIITITVIYKTTKNNEEIFRITRKSKSDAV